MPSAAHDAIIQRCLQRYTGLGELLSCDTVVSVCEAHDYDEQKAIATLDEMAAFSVKDSPPPPARGPPPAAARNPIEAHMYSLAVQGMHTHRDPQPAPPAAARNPEEGIEAHMYSL
eukprot:Hpha_TRINITY_DN16404_c5_g6::TRINITY_DN16404_c5_g6_i3::g.161022::m.161022